MTRFLPQYLAGQQLDASNYALGNRDGTDLSLITGPYIWGDVVAQALSAYPVDGVSGYASPCQDESLKNAIAEREGVAAENVWLVAGADNGIEILLERFLAAGTKLGILAPNFPRFSIVARTIEGVSVEHFGALDAVPQGTSMVALCSPCNPTTEELDEERVRSTIAANPDTLFCIDSVFSWYASWNSAALCRDYDNVVVLKSYSKIGLAGLRLGYIIGPKELVAAARLGRSPFSVPGIVQAIGFSVERAISRTVDIGGWLEERLEFLEREFGDCLVRKSAVPFYLLRVSGPATVASRRLAERGILVVDASRFVGMPDNLLRIAIGGDEDNIKLAGAVRELGLLP